MADVYQQNGYCVECEVPQLSRNHYFTGKLLVLRDFNDEQRYFIGKDRRHNQRLHGWGTVCGLKVKQHPQEGCRDRWVIVEPGTAIDCCGREIIIDHEEFFDFRSAFLSYWQHQFGNDAQPDDQSHTLQICLRYYECPNEEVPAVLDDCGCEDDACQPNRIREAFELGLIVDPTVTLKDPTGVAISWNHTINTLGLIHFQKIALIDDQLYVLTSDNPGKVFAFDATHDQSAGSQDLPARARDFARATDGKRLFVAVDQADPVVIVDTVAPNFGVPVASLTTLPGATNGDLRLLTSPDGRVYALNRDTQAVSIWDDMDTKLGADINVGNTPQDIAFVEDANLMFVADPGDANLKIIDTVALTLTGATITLPGITPSRLLARTVGGVSRLFVVDTTNHAIQVIGVQPSLPDPYPLQGGPISFGTEELIDLAVSPGGRWIYVLLRDSAGKGFVQAVDAHRLEAGDTTNAPGEIIAIGDDPGSLMLSDDGRRLYVSFNGGAGGIAVIDVSEAACADIFNQIIDCCPGCDEVSECLVLSTIADYVYGNEVVDAEIDNLKDRQLLPSTSVIAEAVKCILDQGTGTGGRGENGAPGRDGLGIDDVAVTFVECDQPGSATITGTSPNRTLTLEIPQGCNGNDGESGSGIDDIQVETLECGMSAAATLSGASPNRTLTLGIPRGCDGKDGEGIDLVVAKTLDCDSEATAVLSGASPNRTLTLGIPRGCDGQGGELSHTGIIDLHVPGLEQLNRKPFISDPIPHCFKEGIRVGIMLAVEAKDEQGNKFEQWESVNFMGTVFSFGLMFLAARTPVVPDGTFTIAIAHSSNETETFHIRWVAVPAEDCQPG